MTFPLFSFFDFNIPDICGAAPVWGCCDAGDNLADLGAAEEISFRLGGRKAFALFQVGRHASGSESARQPDDDQGPERTGGGDDRLCHGQAAFDAGRFLMRERDADMGTSLCDGGQARRLKAASVAASGSAARDDDGGAVCYTSRMKARKPPEFRPSGAAMNNPAMGGRLRRKYLGEAARPSPRPPGARERLLAHVSRCYPFSS